METNAAKSSVKLTYSLQKSIGNNFTQVSKWKPTFFPDKVLVSSCIVFFIKEKSLFYWSCTWIWHKIKKRNTFKNVASIKAFENKLPKNENYVADILE